MVVPNIRIPVRTKLAALGIGSILLVSACDNQPTLEERKEQARVQAQARVAVARGKALQRLAKRHAAKLFLPHETGSMFYSLGVESELGMQANRRIAVRAEVLDIRRTARGGYVVEANTDLTGKTFPPELFLQLSCTREQALAALRTPSNGGFFGNDFSIVLTVDRVRKLILAVQAREYGNSDEENSSEEAPLIHLNIEAPIKDATSPKFILHGNLVAIEP